MKVFKYQICFVSESLIPQILEIPEIRSIRVKETIRPNDRIVTTTSMKTVMDNLLAMFDHIGRNGREVVILTYSGECSVCVEENAECKHLKDFPQFVDIDILDEELTREHFAAGKS